MKQFLILILSLSFSIVAMAQDSLGFTNKAEAKNNWKHLKKEGKWIEYSRHPIRPNPIIFHKNSKDTNAPYYKLLIYKAGKPYGMARWFCKNGHLLGSINYSNGKINGLSNIYYPDGKILSKLFFKDGKRDGKQLEYYENGVVKVEYAYINGKENGVRKWYNENGKLKSEAIYKNDRKDITKSFDENGNEIK